MASGSADQLERGDHDRWDSGRVDAAESIAIPYAGAAASHAEVHWKVFVWDQDGQRIESECAYFTFGLLDPAEELNLINYEIEVVSEWNPTHPDLTST